MSLTISVDAYEVKSARYFGVLAFKIVSAQELGMFPYCLFFYYTK